MNFKEGTNTSWMLPGEICWFEVAEGSSSSSTRQLYFQGKIIRVEQAKVYVSSEGKEQAVSPECVSERSKDSKEGGWEDMVSMAVLNEAEILANVQLRFLQDMIFTYIGPTLIVVNPYKLIQKSFLPEILHRFQSALNPAVSPAGFNPQEHPPHVYALAASAYAQLFANRKNQAIVISGESGAGKTENAKFAMQFITSLSSMQEKKPSNSTNNINVPMEEKILRCNPILEAFGNAKTVRNNNSSRFGKYVRILIEEKSKKIQGAAISNYLLEKSRVTVLAQGERNYHIFYAFLSGLSNKHELLVSAFKNGFSINPGDFFYLNQSTSFQAEGIDDYQFFDEVISALPKLGFSQSQQVVIFQLLAAILTIGNLEFDDKTFSDANPCSVKNMDVLSKAAEFLQVNKEELVASLVFKRRVFSGSNIDTPISGQECCVSRDSMARAVYDKLFAWLVEKLNETIIPQRGEDGCMSLGLLDIFGFENFSVNSLEQLCINFANEKLQQLYIMYVFKSEAEEFKAEGLLEQLKSVEFKDNQAIIDVLSKPALSLYDLLDESCALAQGTDETLLAKIIKQHCGNSQSNNQKQQQNQQNESLIFTKPTTSRQLFTLRHTAKDVEYTITGFRIKNKDEISDSLHSLLSASHSEIVQNIWNSSEDQSNQQKNNTKAKKYLGAKFRNQMQSLMQELTSCDAHFIRCIKPNELKRAELFDQTFSMQQIRYLGILESVRVRKQGYPARFTYSMFFNRYGELAEHSKRVSTKVFEGATISKKKQICHDVLFCPSISIADKQEQTSNMSKQAQSQQKQMAIKKEIKLQELDMLMGSSKVYLKLVAANNLDERLFDVIKIKKTMAGKIVKKAKAFLYKRHILLGLKQLQKRIKKFTVIQKAFRRKREEKKRLRLKSIKEGLDTLKQMYEMRLYQSFQMMCAQFSNQKLVNATKYMDDFLKTALKANLRSGFKAIQDIVQKMKQEQQQQEEQKQQIDGKVNGNNGGNELGQEQEGQDQEDQEEFDENEEDQEDDEESNEKKIKDEFVTCGLDVWPCISIKEDRLERQLIEENTNDILANFLKSNQTQEYESVSSKKYQNEYLATDTFPIDPDANVLITDLQPQFIKRVMEQNFFAFCDNYINKSVKNFGKKMPPISEIMSYSKNNLVDPLQKNEEIRNHSQLIFRSILKLAKNRRSRFNPSTHIENVILMCYGTPEKMQEVIFSSVRDESTKIAQNFNSKYSSSASSFMSVARANNNNNNNDQSTNNSRSTNNQSTFNNSDMQSEDEEPNIREILANKITQIVGNCHQAVRDECYLQLCKQSHNQPSHEGLRILLQFTKHLTLLFPPSDFLTIPLMNFFLYMNEKITDESCKQDCRIIFVKLGRIWQSYNMIKLVDFSQYTFDFLMENQVYRDVDKDITMRELIQKKISPFDFFYAHLIRVESREILPGDWEREAIIKNNLFSIRIFLLNEMSLTVTAEANYSVKQIRDLALRQLGLSHRNQYFGIVACKITDNNKFTEIFLKNNQKILDALNLQNNERRYMESIKKFVMIKLYLRVKICYRLYRCDMQSIDIYFIQMQFDVRRGRHNLKPNECFLLAALHLWADYGPYTPAGESLYIKYALSFLPFTLVQPKLTNEYYDNIIATYKNLNNNIESTAHAKWSYIEFLRMKDTFMTYQLESHIYSVRSKDQSYQKSKEAEFILLAIRPSQIVILNTQDKSTKEVIELEQIATWGLNVAQKSKPSAASSYQTASSSSSQSAATSQSSAPQQYFFIKVKDNDTLYVFSIFYLHVANLLIHSYALKRSIGEDENEYKDSFLDILSILFDKEEQSDAE